MLLRGSRKPPFSRNDHGRDTGIRDCLSRERDVIFLQAQNEVRPPEGCLDQGRVLGVNGEGAIDIFQLREDCPDIPWCRVKGEPEVHDVCSAGKKVLNPLPDVRHPVSVHDLGKDLHPRCPADSDTPDDKRTVRCSLCRRDAGFGLFPSLFHEEIVSGNRPREGDLRQEGEDEREVCRVTGTEVDGNTGCLLHTPEGRNAHAGDDHHVVVVLHDESLQLVRCQERGDLPGHDHAGVKAPCSVFHHCPGCPARGQEDAHKSS